MQYIIDSIEDGIASLEAEDESLINIDINFLPKGAKEGSVIDETNGIFSLNEEETQKRRQKIIDLQNLIKFGKK